MKLLRGAGLAFVVTLLVVSNQHLSASSELLQGQVPSGKWTVSASPFFGAGYRTRPVVVTAVQSRVVNEAKGVRVDRVWLKNISNKPVIAVKLGWRLFTEKDRDSVLLRGETPLLGISLPAYSEETAKVKDPKLEFPLLTFTEKVIASLLKEKKLEGDYSIEVFVTEILFEDGSTWIETSSSSESLKVTPLVLSQRCPKQRCRFVSEGAYYMCEGSFLMESCSNAINSCCNVACQEGTVPECGG